MVARKERASCTNLAMPKRTGLEVLRELNIPAKATPVRVILLTAHIEHSQIVEALRLGAQGVVLKDSATLAVGMRWDYFLELLSKDVPLTNNPSCMRQ